VCALRDNTRRVVDEKLFFYSVVRIMASSSSASKMQGKKSKESKSKRGSKAPRSGAADPRCHVASADEELLMMVHEDVTTSTSAGGCWNTAAVHWSYGKEEVQLRLPLHMHLLT
jgi:hypothetical protein